MVSRDLHVSITGDSGDFDRATKSAAQSALAFERELTKLETAQAKNGSTAAKTASATKSLGTSFGNANRSANLMRSELVSLVAGAAALTPAVAAAGAGFVAFGAVAAPALVSVIGAQADLAKHWGEMDAAQRAAALSLQDFIAGYKTWAAQFQPGVLAAFNTGLRTMDDLMGALSPVAAQATSAVGILAQKLREGLGGAEAKEFFTFLETNARPTMLALGDLGGQLATTFTDLLIALNPLAQALIPAVGAVSSMVSAVAEANPQLVQMAVAMVALKAPITALVTNATKLGPALAAMATGANPAGLAIAGLTAVLAGIAVSFANARTNADEFAASVAQRGAAGGYAGQLKAVSAEMDRLKAKQQQQIAAQRNVNTAAVAGVEATHQAVGAYKSEKVSIDGLKRKKAELKAALAAERAATITAAEGTNLLKRAFSGARVSADTFDQALDALTQSFHNSFNAETRFEEAIDSARQSLKQNGKTLDSNTAKGRANRDALQLAAGAAIEQAKAMKRSGASASAASGKFANNANRIYEMARRMGLSRDRAQQLTGKLLGIPKNVRSQIGTPGLQAAIQGAETLKARIDAIPRHIDITVRQSLIKQEIAQAGRPRVGKTGGRIGALAGAPGYKSGGLIRGRGTGTSDSIPALADGGRLLRVSNGEYLVNAASAQANLGLLRAINSGATVQPAARGPMRVAGGRVEIDLRRSVAEIRDLIVEEIASEHEFMDRGV